MKLLNTDTLDQVQEKLNQYFDSENEKTRTESVSIRNSVGRYASAEIKSDIDMPAFRRSVVDGYAVKASDTFGASDSIPAFLTVIGQVEMGGQANVTISRGQAVYVPTGGMIPEGSDGMVMIEYVEILSGANADAHAGSHHKTDDGEFNPFSIAVYKPATPNGHIMNIGDDFRMDQILFERGHRFSVKDVGMLAACGKKELRVFQKPRIAILSTGDEIIDICEEPALGEIRDINSYAIAAFAEACGAEVTEIRIQKDDFDGLSSQAGELFEKNDIFIMSGGSSAGVKDMTSDIIAGLGMPGVLTHGIAIKPGKPTVIGAAQNTAGKYVLAVGLPGHPMSAIIVFKTVIEPFIKRYYFKNTELASSIPAAMTENLHAGEGRETYQLVTLAKKDGIRIASPIHGKSGSIRQLADADGYVRIPSLSEGVNNGDIVDVILL